MAYVGTHAATVIVPPVPLKAGVIHTCPMHPQIRQMRPGNCPIAAQMAVYKLLGNEREVPPILHHDRSIKVKLDALIKAFK